MSVVIPFFRAAVELSCMVGPSAKGSLKGSPIFDQIDPAFLQFFDDDFGIVKGGVARRKVNRKELLFGVQFFDNTIHMDFDIFHSREGGNLLIKVKDFLQSGNSRYLIS